MEEAGREARLDRWRARLPDYARRYEAADRDGELRLVIYTKAFSIWPLHRQQTMELTMLGYMEATQAAPIFALEQSLEFLIRSPRSGWRPSAGEVLEFAAVASQNVLRYLRGEDGEVEPVSRRYELNTTAIEYAIRSGRRLVDQPDPEPTEGFITPAFAAALTDVLGDDTLTGKSAIRISTLARLKYPSRGGLL